jgi:acetyl-CoA carboxylase carboxyltransferase component
MAGQGFDPDFIFTWPTGRMGVMEGESAVMALFGPQLDELKQKRQEPDAALQQKIEAVRADYEHQLDARFAAARGFVDAILAPEDTRATLAAALFTALHNSGPHLGPFGGVDGGAAPRHEPVPPPHNT